MCVALSRPLLPHLAPALTRPLVAPQVVYEDARMLRDVFNRAYVQCTYQGQPVDPLPRVAQRS